MNYWKLKFLRLRHGMKRSFKRKSLLLIAIALFLLGAIAWGSHWLFNSLAHSGEFPEIFRVFIAEKIMLMVAMVMFAMIVLSSMISTLNIFFLSPDLPMLMATPMPHSRLFLWKTLDTLLTSTVMVWVFFLPVLSGFCIHFSHGIASIAGIMFVFLTFVLLGAFFGMVTGMLVPLFISIRRLRPALSIIGILLISGVVVLLRLAQPERFFQPGAIQDLYRYMRALDIRGLAGTPFYWLSRAMGALSQRDARQFILFSGLLVATLLALMAGMRIIRQRLFLSLVDRVRSNRSFHVTRNFSQKCLSIRATLLKKEALTFIRSPDQWSQLIIIAAITAVFILNVRAIPRIQAGMNILTAFLNMGMTAFVIAGLNSRFAFPTMPLEDRGLVHVLVSPAPRNSLLHAKLMAYIPPQVVLGICIYLAGHMILHLDTFMLWTGLVFLIPGLTYISLLAFRFGLEVLPGVNETPENLLLSRSGIFFMLSALSFIILSMLLFAPPIARYYLQRFRGLPPPTVFICTWYGGYLIITGLLSRLAWRKSHHLWDIWEN